MNNLGINISHDSVLRLLKKLPGYEQPATIDESIIHIGLDDFSFKKGSSYGTLLCDLDTRKVIEVLPDRTKECVSAWLNNHPNIQVVSRNDSTTYASAIQEALPSAIRISDKFHLVKNLLDYVNTYISRTYPRHILLEDIPVPNDDNKDDEEASALDTKDLKDVSPIKLIR